MLLEPGAGRAPATTDAALLDALLRVELAWVRVQRRLGLVGDDLVAQVEGAADPAAYDPEQLAAESESAGNPALPVVTALRAAVRERSPEAALAVHRGLTSQDVLDSALMTLAARSLGAVATSLAEAADSAAALAAVHRDSIAVARTLGQWALPTTFGLKAAGWLGALDDVVVEVRLVSEQLPVQCGGAVGTLAAIDRLAPGRSLEAADLLAEELGLAASAPWHTSRGVVTRCGDALVRSADVMGKIASDVVLLSRPEVAELAEPAAPGRGASSTLPQKRNPVLSVLVRAVGIEAPHLGAALHSASGLAADERPDGAWHAEWGPFVRLLDRVATAASQLAEVLSGLEVDVAAMGRNVQAAGPALVAEHVLGALAELGAGADAVSAVRELLRGGASAAEIRLALRHHLGADVLPDDRLDRLLDPAAYLGAAAALIDRALLRHQSLGGEVR